jgi:hypothetical protein
MSKSNMGMAPNQHWSTLNPPVLFCPTSKAEFLNLVVSFWVSNIVLKPPSLEKHLNFSPPLHRVEPLFDRWVGVLEVPRVWLLWHAKVVPP